MFVVIMRNEVVLYSGRQPGKGRLHVANEAVW